MSLIKFLGMVWGECKYVTSVPQVSSFNYSFIVIFVLCCSAVLLFVKATFPRKEKRKEIGKDQWNSMKRRSCLFKDS